MAVSRYEPLPRIGHFAAGAEERLYVLGGGTKDFHKIKSELESSVEIFNTHLETWDKIVTKGSPPPGLYWGACASSGQYIYTYGGSDGSSLQGTLNQLDTKTYKWKLLSPHTNGGPMKKSGCKMVFYQTKLVLFGGYIGDSPTGHAQPGASYKDRKTNELHVFDLKEGEKEIMPHLNYSVIIIIISFYLSSHILGSSILYQCSYTSKIIHEIDGLSLG